MASHALLLVIALDSTTSFNTQFRIIEKTSLGRMLWLHFIPSLSMLIIGGVYFWALKECEKDESFSGLKFNASYNSDMYFAN